MTDDDDKTDVVHDLLDDAADVHPDGHDREVRVPPNDPDLLRPDYSEDLLDELFQRE